MAEIAENEVRGFVDKVKDLANGTIADQLKACQEYLCEKLFPNGDCVDRSVIPEVLPFIVKCLTSKNPHLQMEGAFFVTAIVWNDTKCENDNRRIYKEDAKLSIEAGAIPKLVQLLSSKNAAVLDQSLGCLVKIAAHYPKEVVQIGALPHLKRLLKSRNDQLSCKAAKGLFYVLNECEEYIINIITEPLIQLLKSKNNEICADALHTLVNIVSRGTESCQFLLDHNILKHLYKLLIRPKPIHLLIVRFIKKVASYGEDQVDMIIRENFVPFVISQLDGRITGIKIEGAKAIVTIVQSKHAFVPNLVHQYDIIALLCNKLNSSNVTFLENILTALNEIIYIFEDKEMSRRMVKNSVNLKNLENLLKHRNETIRGLSETLNNFVIDKDVKPLIPQKRNNVLNNNDHGTIELDSSDDDDSNADENVTTLTSQKRRRPSNAHVEEPNPTSKRSKHLHRQNEPSVRLSFNFSSGNERLVTPHNDFDDVSSRHHSPIGTRYIPVPSNQTRLQSNVNQAANDETDRNENSVGPASHYQNADSDHILTPPSFVEPGLPEGTKTLDDTTPTNNTFSLSTPIHSGVPPTEPNQSIQRGVPPTESSQSIQSSGLSTQSDPTVHSVNPSTESTFSPEVTTKIEAGNNILTKPSPARTSPPLIEIVLPAELTQTRNENVFEAVKYYRPPEQYMDSCCRNFEEIDLKKVHFDSDIYSEFVLNIKIKSISQHSKPDTCYQTNDTSGFSCLSLLFTGTEKYTETIRENIYEKYTKDEMDKKRFNGARIGSIVGLPHVLKKEHLETLSDWFKCRIMVYCNGEGWKQYGKKESEGESYVPIFVLEKKEIKGKYIYQVVFSVKE